MHPSQIYVKTAYNMGAVFLGSPPSGRNHISADFVDAVLNGGSKPKVVAHQINS